MTRMLALRRLTTFPDQARSGRSGGGTPHDPQAVMALVQALQDPRNFQQTTQPQGERGCRKPFGRLDLSVNTLL